LGWLAGVYPKASIRARRAPDTSIPTTDGAAHATLSWDGDACAGQERRQGAPGCRGLSGPLVGEHETHEQRIDGADPVVLEVVGVADGCMRLPAGLPTSFPICEPSFTTIAVVEKKPGPKATFNALSNAAVPLPEAQGWTPVRLEPSRDARSA
jgi:hypothetical protein